jgi:hypothetical protein
MPERSGPEPLCCASGPPVSGERTGVCTAGPLEKGNCVYSFSRKARTSSRPPFI